MERLELFGKGKANLKKSFEGLLAHSSMNAIPYWIGATATGLVAVAYAHAFKVIGAVPVRLFETHPYWLLACSPICFMVGWWFVHRLAPEATGSGIPQLLAASELNPQTKHREIDALLGVKTAAVKIVSSLFCALGGGAIGREGPTLQIAATIFFHVGRRFRTALPKTTPHSWIVVGGAAGIASAFNTPLGGIVYAMEELATTHFNHFRTMLILAVIVSGLMAQWISGSYLYLGFPKVQAVTFSFIPFALGVGITTGLAGGFFGRMLYLLSRKRSAIRSEWRLLLLAGALGVCVALLALLAGSRSIGPGVEAISDLLFRKAEVASVGLILARFAGTLMSYLSGCAGGIFSPSLAIGAVIGSKLAAITQAPDANLMVLLGMIGFLTGVIRAPFTAFVLVQEMTDRHSAIFPMMLVALSAFAASRLVDSSSFYERRKLQYLESGLRGDALADNRP